MKALIDVHAPTIGSGLDGRHDITFGATPHRSMKLPHAMMIGAVVISPMVVVAMIIGVAA